MWICKSLCNLFGLNWATRGSSSHSRVGQSVISCPGCSSSCPGISASYASTVLPFTRFCCLLILCWMLPSWTCYCFCTNVRSCWKLQKWCLLFFASCNILTFIFAPVLLWWLTLIITRVLLQNLSEWLFRQPYHLEYAFAPVWKVVLWRELACKELEVLVFVQ